MTTRNKKSSCCCGSRIRMGILQQQTLLVVRFLIKIMFKFYNFFFQILPKKLQGFFFSATMDLNLWRSLQKVDSSEKSQMKNNRWSFAVKIKITLSPRLATVPADTKLISSFSLLFPWGLNVYVSSYCCCLWKTVTYHQLTHGSYCSLYLISFKLNSKVDNSRRYCTYRGN